MLERTSHYLFGYAKFAMHGNPARLITLAAKSGITLWGFQKQDGIDYACVKARHYKRLRPIAKRCDTRLSCEEKRGLPFFAHRAWGRKGLLIGAVAFVFLYLFLNRFYWQISVNGAESLSEARVLRAAEEQGVFVGARKDSFKPVAAAKRMMSELEEISWISINTNGSYITIELKEREKKPLIESEGAISNLVAAKEGVITAIEAESGMKLVDIGDTVYKGQTLVTGIYTEEINPYIEKKLPPVTKMVPSRGSVRAQTLRTFTVSVPLVRQEEEILEEKHRKYLICFGLKIPLGLHFSTTQPLRVYERKEMLTMLDKELPIGLIYETNHLYGPAQKKLTEEEAKQEAMLKLRDLQKKELNLGGRVISEEISVKITDETYHLHAVSSCEEEIAVVQEILFDSTIQ